MQIYGIINNNYEGECINVQCSSHPGFPSFEISGLADSIVKEAKERVREGIRASGFRFPQESILISLAPSGIHKTGSALDLPIALSVLFAKSSTALRVLAHGEVDLNGNILQSPGAENAILNAEKLSCHAVVLSGKEDRVVKKKQFPFCIIYAKTLESASNAVIDIINDENFDYSDKTGLDKAPSNSLTNPFKGIIGLNNEKEILTAAIAGGHNVLFFGPKGIGKTMLITRAEKLIAEGDDTTKEELSRIRSCFNLFPENKGNVMYLNDKDSITKKGGELPEILLSHSAAVIADEITNINENVLSVIRDIQDKGKLTVSKRGTFPLRFSFIAAMNPCPCGALGSKRTPCNCPQNRIQAHLKNISSTLLTRFSAVYDVQEADYVHDNDMYFSDAQDRINNAIKRMERRYADFPCVHRNADIMREGINRDVLEKAFMYFPESENPREALVTYSFALTLADLDDSDIKPIHTEKARFYRIKDILSHYTR